MVKNPPANAGDIKDVGFISGSGRSPGEGHGNPLQYSCLGNPMDRGAWQATVHGVARVGHDLVTKAPPSPPPMKRTALAITILPAIRYRVRACYESWFAMPRDQDE